jgi:hypothetical protein
MKNLFAVVFSVLGFIELSAQDIDKKAFMNYINPELYGEFVDGYLVTKDFEKIPAKIRYEHPTLYQNNRHPVVTLNKRGKEQKNDKSGLAGFSVNGQMFVPEIVAGKTMWLMLTIEGAIQQTILFQAETSHYPPEYFTINHLVTHNILNESYYVGHLAINFNRTMAKLVSDNEALAARISSKDLGYHFVNYQKLIAEYNLWYNRTNPGKVKYLLPVPDYQQLIDRDAGKLVEGEH